MSDLTLGSPDYMSLLNQTGKTGAAGNIDAMKNKDLSNASDEELMSACKEFEAYFLEMVMKEMTKNVNLTGSTSDSGSSTLLDYYKDQTISSLAAQSTERSSLGLAQQMYEQMKRSSQSVSMADIQAHQESLRTGTKKETDETESV
ncbi:MAG: rod-binding protein [Lachnospiraceae bacterium]|nr:rod-binding protein [Lachnospiraceae bacterium]